MSQWIRVDDFDGRIGFSSGGWAATQTSGLSTTDYDFLNLQDAFLGTAHTVIGTDKGTQSGFSFAFNGTGVAAYGMFLGLSSVCVENCKDEDILAPSFACFIDGVSIPSNQPFGHFPWQSYCEKEDLPDGPHVFSAQIFHKNASQPSGFYLDFVQYLPSTSSLSDLDQGYRMIDSADPQIPWQEWVPLGSAKMTQDGGDLSFEFTGTGLTWYSLSPYAIATLDPSLLEMFTNTTGAILCNYTIDGGDPVSFSISIVPITLDPKTYNNIMLQTATLPAGKHNLTASGFLPGYPLTLDYLIVQQAPIPGTTTATISSPAASSQATQVDNLTQGRHINTGAIAGGAIGGTLFVLTLLVFLFLFYRRRKSRAVDGDSIFGTDSLSGTIKIEPFKDSLEKPIATPSFSDSENPTLVAAVPLSQAKKPTLSRFQSYPASVSASSSNSHLPLIPPVPPKQHNTSDPFRDPDLFKPFDATHLTLSVSIPEGQPSTSSLHNHSQPPSAEEVEGSCPHPPSNLSPPRDRHQSRHTNHQELEIAESQNSEEQAEVGHAPRPSQHVSVSRSTHISSDRHFSRIVRHADSGIRLTRTRSENILELPPEYTME